MITPAVVIYLFRTKNAAKINISDEAFSAGYSSASVDGTNPWFHERRGKNPTHYLVGCCV
jgi:hypothetical protein